MSKKRNWRQWRQRLKIEREKEGRKLHGEKQIYTEHLKHWWIPREDTECNDDLTELPEVSSKKTRYSPKIFNDALTVLEFLKAFGEFFELQGEFPKGVILEVLEEALVGNNSEGPVQVKQKLEWGFKHFFHFQAQNLGLHATPGNVDQVQNFEESKSFVKFEH